MSRCKQHSNDFIETEIGRIPGEWDLSKLSNIAQIIVSNVDKKFNSNESPVYLCNYLDVYQNGNITNNLKFMRGSASEAEIDKFSLRCGDVLITKDSETAEDIASAAVVAETIPNLICGYHLAILRPEKDRVDSYYLAMMLQHNRVHNQFVTKANGVTRYGLTLSVINNATVLVPPLVEQVEIAKILSAWDHAIERVQRLIEAKQRQKAGLLQGLLSGRVRFPDFGHPCRSHEELPEGWELAKIGKLVKRVRTPVDINPHQIYRELGIRSHGKGIFHKEVCLGTEIGNKSIFWVKPNTFILNIVFAWEQAISRTTSKEEGMVASHRFPMYQPIEELLDLDYFVNYFLTSRGKTLLGLVSPGGAGRNKTLNQDAFLKLVIPLPPISEQKKVSTFIKCYDRELEVLERYKDTLIIQKQGVLQKLLSGEIRVNVN